MSEPSTHATVRWGIIGTGNGARTFAGALRKADGAELVAVGSRAQNSADRFAAACEIPRGYGSYETLVHDPDIDVVYIATPHARHHDDTLLCLDAGKHVLCEKPFALNAKQAIRMAERARERKLFLMEGIWSRFLPAYRTLNELLADNAVGEILAVEASFGFRAAFDPADRLFDLETGGGALLDLGLYPVQLAHVVLGAPTGVSATARIGETGVDEHIVVTMSFAGGALAVAHAAIRAPLDCRARITGVAGFIELPAFMHCPGHLVVESAGERRQIDAPLGPSPFGFEIAEVQRCIQNGATESTTMPLDDSCAIAHTLDLSRASIGLRYPGE